MMIEIFSALGAISLGASLGVYLVASEASLPSFSRSAQRLAWWARDKDDAATVSGGLPWRLAASDCSGIAATDTESQRLGDTEGVQVEAFCALCEEPLVGIDPPGPNTDGSMITPRCPQCGVRYPLTEGMLLDEVIAIARRALLERPLDESPVPAEPVGAGRFAQR